MPAQTAAAASPPLDPAARREAAKRAKLARIEATARALFDAHGYEGTTTRAIAEGAGIGTGTLFLYFKEKRDLLVHLLHGDVERTVARAVDGLDSPETPGELADTVGELLTGACAVYDARPNLARVFLKEILFLEDATASERWVASLRVPLERQLAEARRQGLLRADVDPSAIALQLVGLLHFVLARWCGGAVSASERDALLRRFVAHTLAGCHPAFGALPLDRRE